jgi:uncharacterized protein YicC (UPF0701 family)
MENYYFITGILSTFVAILLYQYNKILTFYKLIQRNQKNNTEAYEQWIEMTTKALDEIREKVNTDQYADAATFNREVNAVSTRINAVESQINTLAKKEENDVKKLENGLKQITVYIKGVVEEATDNRGY